MEGSRAGTSGLLATVGDPGRPGVVLAANADVVAADSTPWRSDPFALRRAEGRLYGRGTADMKGFLASALAVLPLAARHAGTLTAPILLALSWDEELGCQGVGPLLDRLAQGARPLGCIVGEPTELRVGTAHKGKASARVVVRGLAAHSSRPPEAVNAVEYAARLIVATREVGLELAAAGTDPSFTIDRATVSTGPIAGGTVLNVVPDRCAFELEVRSLPGQDPRKLLTLVLEPARALMAEMREHADAAAITVEPKAAYPGLAPGGSEAWATRVGELAATPGTIALDYGTEAGLYRERLGAPVVVCGPGSMAQGHTVDKFVDADQLDRCCGFLGRLVRSLAS